MLIRVYGPGCAKCEETERLVRQAVKDAGADAEVEKVSDLKEMLAHGIMSTPAVAIDGEIVCRGRVPGREEIPGWLSGGRGACAPAAGGSCACGGKC